MPFSFPRRRAAALVAGIALTAALVPSAAQATVVTNPGASLAFGVATGGSGTLNTLSASGAEATVTMPTGETFAGGMAYDSSGDLYFATSSGTIYEVPVGGSTPTQVGSGVANPGYMTTDPAGNLYVASFGSNGITKIAAGTHAVTVLNSGTVYYGIGANAAGDLYAVDGSYNIVKFTAGAGSPTTVVAAGGSARTGLAVAPDGTFYVMTLSSGTITHYSASGTSLGDLATVTGAQTALTSDRNGNIYAVKAVSGTVSVVEFVGGSSTQTTVANYSGTGTTTLSAVPSFSPAPGGTTSSATPAITRAKAAARKHRLSVTATHLAAGETYRVVLGKRTLTSGVASSAGAVSTKVRLPRCLGGRHYIKVIGSTSGKLIKRFYVKRTYPHRCTGLF